MRWFLSKYRHDVCRATNNACFETGWWEHLESLDNHCYQYTNLFALQEKENELRIRYYCEIFYVDYVVLELNKPLYLIYSMVDRVGLLDS